MLVTPSEARNLGFRRHNKTEGAPYLAVFARRGPRRTLTVYQRPSIPLPILLHPRPHNSLHQRVCQRLVSRELNRPLRGPISLQLFLKSVKHPRPRRKQTAMILKRRIPDQHPVVLEHRHPVADHLSRLLGHDGLNDRANMLQSRPRRLRRVRQILIHGLRSLTLPHILSS